MTDTHDDLVLTGLQASVKVIMSMVAEKARSLGLGGMVIVVVDETGDYTAMQMVSNVRDDQLVNAVAQAALSIVDES